MEAAGGAGGVTAATCVAEGSLRPHYTAGCSHTKAQSREQAAEKMKPLILQAGQVSARFSRFVLLWLRPCEMCARTFDLSRHRHEVLVEV